MVNGIHMYDLNFPRLLGNKAHMQMWSNISIHSELISISQHYQVIVGRTDKPQQHHVTLGNYSI